MTPPGTFDRVYAAIKDRLRGGTYRPGSRLEPAALSDELNASVTPVRDALHRLTGERLIEAPRHEGFRVPLMTEALLRQLYEWHLDLLLLATMKHRSTAATVEAAAPGTVSTSDPIQRENDLFDRLARSSGNIEIAITLDSLKHRLQPAQRLEELYIAGTEQETNEILEAFARSDRKALRAALTRYHRRRQRIVPDLLAALYKA